MDGGVNVGRAKPEAAAAEMREMWIIFFGTSAWFGEIWKFINKFINFLLEKCVYMFCTKSGFMMSLRTCIVSASKNPPKSS